MRIIASSRLPEEAVRPYRGKGRQNPEHLEAVRDGPLSFFHEAEIAGAGRGRSLTRRSPTGWLTSRRQYSLCGARSGLGHDPIPQRNRSRPAPESLALDSVVA